MLKALTHTHTAPGLVWQWGDLSTSTRQHPQDNSHLPSTLGDYSPPYVKTLGSTMSITASTVPRGSHIPTDTPVQSSYWNMAFQGFIFLLHFPTTQYFVTGTLWAHSRHWDRGTHSKVFSNTSTQWGLESLLPLVPQHQPSGTLWRGLPHPEGASLLDTFPFKLELWHTFEGLAFFPTLSCCNCLLEFKCLFPPKFLCCNSDHWWEGIWKWGHWKVIMSWGWRPDE